MGNARHKTKTFAKGMRCKEEPLGRERGMFVGSELQKRATATVPRCDSRIFDLCRNSATRKYVVIVVALTLTHRYNAVRGHRTGSNT